MKTSPADHTEEFTAKTLPAGSAPADKTFKPNTAGEVPPVEDNLAASETIGGATSADVRTGLGHPGQGMTSQEIHHDGGKQGKGLVGVGASSLQTGGISNAPKAADEHDPAFVNQRGLKGEAQGQTAGTRGTIGGPAAEERLPETSETVASEAPRDR